MWLVIVGLMEGLVMVGLMEVAMMKTVAAVGPDMQVVSMDFIHTKLGIICMGRSLPKYLI